MGIVNTSNIILVGSSPHKDAFHLPLLDYNYLQPNIDFTKYNTLIVTSKNGIKSLKNYGNEWKSLEIYVIGKSTYDEAISIGANVINEEFFSTGKEFANYITDNLQSKKILYIRAKEVATDIFSIVKEQNIDINEAITYESVCKSYNENFIFPNDSTFIFTSPKTVRCFLNKFEWKSSYKAIALGKTTAKSINFTDDIKISPIPSIDNAVKLAKLS